jgi:hypothetical protein
MLTLIIGNSLVPFLALNPGRRAGASPRKLGRAAKRPALRIDLLSQRHLRCCEYLLEP